MSMKKVFSFIWRMLRGNLVLKVMALLFAVILWSYVLTDINPPRERVMDDIKVRFSNADELRAKGLDISGSLSDVLDTVDIRLEVRQSDLKYLSDQNVRATVDLSTINGPGPRTLKISATTTYGQVLEVNPPTVDLYVDSYETRTIPVNVEVTGSVPEGYYASDPEISPGVVTISGASVDVEKAAGAVCTIDLNGLTEGFNKSVEVQLLDSDGNAVDKSLFSEGLPSVIVNLKVLAKKTVTINAKSAILGQDELAAGYEIAGISCVPDTVEIVGDAGVLAAVNSISLVPYSVSGASTSVAMLLDYQPPEGVSVLTGNKAQVYIEVRQILETKDYSRIDIGVRNLADGLTAQLSETRTDVSVIAGTAQLSALDRSEIVPFVDLEGLGRGVHTVYVQFELPEGFSAENFSADISTIIVKIL
jgi:YbbR domain-containing protein